jgi:D-ribose pyranose/furanose isomerase RbsD
MRRASILAALLFSLSLTVFAQADWHSTVDQKLPLLGHRNWILIVDSAFPLYSSPGVDVIETSADELEVTQYVLSAVKSSIHVRPDIFMDAELQYVPEADAPGVTAFKSGIGKLLTGAPVQSLPHEKLLAELDQASKVYRVLVLKTNMAVPYTSVFLRLNCKYWSDDAEKRLRQKMGSAGRAGR